MLRLNNLPAVLSNHGASNVSTVVSRKFRFDHRLISKLLSSDSHGPTNNEPFTAVTSSDNS